MEIAAITLAAPCLLRQVSPEKFIAAWKIHPCHRMKLTLWAGLSTYRGNSVSSLTYVRSVRFRYNLRSGACDYPEQTAFNKAMTDNADPGG
jgi:hypothetical protein